MIDSGIDPDFALDLVDILASYTLVNGLIPGTVETWSVILDFKDVSLWETPARSIISWVIRLKRGYHVRNGIVSIVNTPWVIKKATQIVYTFLDPFLTAKVTFYGEDFKPSLQKLIGRENLEKKFGGYIPNKKSDFWPPKYSTKGYDPKLSKKSVNGNQTF